YPNILGFGGQRHARVDPALRLLCIQIFNDAMAELQESSGGRIFPMALLPWWNVTQSAAEARRASEMGLRRININSDPQVHNDETGKPLPDLSQRYWDPLWEVCSHLNLPINFHIGASQQSMEWMGMQGWPTLRHDMRAAISTSMLFLNNGRVLANI